MTIKKLLDININSYSWLFLGKKWNQIMSVVWEHQLWLSGWRVSILLHGLWRCCPWIEGSITSHILSFWSSYELFFSNFIEFSIAPFRESMHPLTCLKSEFFSTTAFLTLKNRRASFELLFSGIKFMSYKFMSSWMRK